jgi:prolyl 4-hydroxylase
MKIKSLSDDPAILIIDDFISKDDCDQIILKYKDKVRKQSTISGSSTNYRNSSSLILDRDCPTLSQISRNIKINLSSDINFFEKPQIHKYEKDQEYLDHYDARDIKQINEINFHQRRNTAIIYLNEDFYGGSTYFKQKNITIIPKQARLLIFENCFKGTDYIHPLSMHSGLKVTKGIKWILSLWSRKRFEINLDNFLKH